MVSCVNTSMGLKEFRLQCLLELSFTSQTSLWKLSYCESRQRNTQCRDGYSVLFITEKILCLSEPPRSLISFVPIDFRNKGGAGGLGTGSIPTIDQKPDNLVYTAAVETDQETQEQLHYSKRSWRV